MKVDQKKELKSQYSTSKSKVTFVSIPSQKYLMVDGMGNPNGEEGQKAIRLLYPVVYTIKFAKKNEGKDFVVMPLEALWWADNMDDFITRKKDNWKWTYMLLVPDFVNEKDFVKAVKKCVDAGKITAPERIRFEKREKENAAQLLHIGSFDNEGDNIEKIHAAICEKGRLLGGHHHEIYLSDFRKTKVEKLRTILRQSYK